MILDAWLSPAFFFFFELEWYMKPEKNRSYRGELRLHPMHSWENMQLESTHIRMQDHNGYLGAFVSHWYIELGTRK